MLKKIVCALGIITFLFGINAHADLIPTGNNPFYYQMGGGQDIPVAAYSGTTSIPLHSMVM